MIRKSLLGVTLLGAVLVASGYWMYLGNVAPSVPPVSAVEAAAGKPYVVKLHA